MDEKTKILCQAFSDYSIRVLDNPYYTVIMAKTMNLTVKALKYRFQKSCWGYEEMIQALKVTQDYRIAKLIDDDKNKALNK